MKQQEGTNSFGGGLVSDLNAITTPNTVLTYCVNGTLLTMNGNELVLQNDMGNTYLIDPLSLDKVQLSAGFIPIGVKEYGGVLYIISKNPTTGESEIGSFPSPLYPEDAVLIGENIEINLPDDLDKTFILSDIIFKPGDPFIINIPAFNYTNFTGDGLTRGRKLYKLKLLTINKKELDITNYFAKNLDSDTSNNEVVLNKPTFINNDYSEQLSNKKVLYYPNNVKSGKIAIKIVLEDIDKFKLDGGLPTVVGDNTSFNLVFNNFIIENLALLKVKDIELKYNFVKDGEIISKTPIIYSRPETGGNNIPILNPFDISPVNTSSVLKIQNIEDRNQFLEYTITPFANYDRSGIGVDTIKIAFNKFIIKNKIDLSKDSFEWALQAIYKKFGVYEYTLDGTNVVSDKTFKLGNNTEEYYSNEPTTNGSIDYFNGPIFQNLKFFTNNTSKLNGSFTFSTNFNPYLYPGYNSKIVISSDQTNTVIKLTELLLNYPFPEDELCLGAGLEYAQYVGWWYYVGTIKSIEDIPDSAENPEINANNKLITLTIDPLNPPPTGVNAGEGFIPGGSWAFRILHKKQNNFSSSNLFDSGLSPNWTSILNNGEPGWVQLPDLIGIGIEYQHAPGMVFVGFGLKGTITSLDGGSNNLLKIENRVLDYQRAGTYWEIIPQCQKSYKLSLKSETNTELILNEFEFQDVPTEHTPIVNINNVVIPYSNLEADKSYKIYAKMIFSFNSIGWDFQDLPQVFTTKISTSSFDLITPNKPGFNLAPLVQISGVVNGVKTPLYILPSGEKIASEYTLDADPLLIENGDFNINILPTLGEATVGVWGGEATRKKDLDFSTDRGYYQEITVGKEIRQQLPTIIENIDYLISFYAKTLTTGKVQFGVGNNSFEETLTTEWKLYKNYDYFDSDGFLYFKALEGTVLITNVTFRIFPNLTKPDVWSLKLQPHTFLTTSGQSINTGHYIPNSDYNLKGYYTINNAGTPTFYNYDNTDEIPIITESIKTT